MFGNLIKAIKHTKGTVDKPGKSKSALQFDLMYQLYYMSVIANAGVPRKQIFEHAAHLTCSTADYFERIELLYQRLKFDYAKGCKLVGETAKEEEVRGLLLRFSNSLLSGEPEAEFLTREAEATAQSFENDYTRKVESLKMWTDAYVSLSLASVLVIIVGIVSTMIYEIQTAFILGLASVAVLTTVVGIWLIHLISPKESTVLAEPGSPEQKMVRKLTYILCPVAIIGFGFSFLTGWGFGPALLIAGVICFPLGWVAMKDDGKVTKRDSELGPLLGSLGGVCAAIGTTVREAIGKIDLDAMDNLKTEIKALYTRLISGINPSVSWKKFIEETGSELTNRSVGMFYDAIDLGGEPGAAGYNASLFSNKMTMLRAKRRSVAGPFRWLCLVMHAAVVALLIFITEVMGIFGNMLSSATGDIDSMASLQNSTSIAGLTSFNFGGLEILHTLMVPLVFIFTISDSLAPTLAEGGSKMKFFYNFGFAAVVSGVALISLPKLAGVLFTTIQL